MDFLWTSYLMLPVKMFLIDFFLRRLTKLLLVKWQNSGKINDSHVTKVTDTEKFCAQILSAKRFCNRFSATSFLIATRITCF